jgi:hypothetical protein
VRSRPEEGTRSCGRGWAARRTIGAGSVVERGNDQPAATRSACRGSGLLAGLSPSADGAHTLIAAAVMSEVTILRGRCRMFAPFKRMLVTIICLASAPFNRLDR